MADFYTSADPAGLQPRGWYPGKKHSVAKRALQAATMGIYNPDNRFASHINKQQIAARATAEEKVNAAKMQQAAELDAITQNLLKYSPGLDPAEAARMAAGYFATQATAATAANEAARSGSDRVRAENEGALPGSSELGRQQVAENTARARAGEINARVVEGENRGALPGAEGFGQARQAAQTITAEAAGANAKNQKLRAQGAESRARDAGETAAQDELTGNLANINANKNRSRFAQALAVENLPEILATNQKGSAELAGMTTADSARKLRQGQAIDTATEIPNIRAAIAGADASANAAEAQSRMLGDVTTADRLAQGQANKNLGLTIPPFTSMLTPFAAPTNQITGQTYPRGAQPTETVETDADGNVVRRVLRQPPGTAAPGATNKPTLLTRDEFERLLAP